MYSQEIYLFVFPSFRVFTQNRFFFLRFSSFLQITEQSLLFKYEKIGKTWCYFYIIFILIQ